jgi:hypothetical protein
MGRVRRRKEMRSRGRCCRRVDADGGFLFFFSSVSLISSPLLSYLYTLTVYSLRFVNMHQFFFCLRLTRLLVARVEGNFASSCSASRPTAPSARRLAHTNARPLPHRPASPRPPPCLPRPSISPPLSSSTTSPPRPRSYSAASLASPRASHSGQ